MDDILTKIICDIMHYHCKDHQIRWPGQWSRLLILVFTWPGSCDTWPCVWGCHVSTCHLPFTSSIHLLFFSKLSIIIIIILIHYTSYNISTNSDNKSLNYFLYFRFLTLLLVRRIWLRRRRCCDGPRKPPTSIPESRCRTSLSHGEMDWLSMPSFTETGKNILLNKLERLRDFYAGKNSRNL